jgi:hypothetical protein
MPDVYGTHIGSPHSFIPQQNIIFPRTQFRIVLDIWAVAEIGGTFARAGRRKEIFDGFF